MQIYLDGIGLIKDSTVKLDGLTVITGENNSGKSTVGKALYAIVDGMIAIDKKQERDELYYIKNNLLNELRSIVRDIDRLPIVLINSSMKTNHDLSDEDNDESEEFSSAIDALLNQKLFFGYNNKEKYADYINKLTYELKGLTHNPENSSFFEHIKTEENTDLLSVFFELQGNALSLCEKIKEYIKRGADTHSFRAKYINHTLRNEFKSEIQPVKQRELLSKILYEDEQGVLFKSIIENNHISIESFSAILYIFSKAYLIDNAFILDEVTTRPLRRANYDIEEDEESIVNTRFIYTHNEKLIQYLSREINHTISFELDVENTFERVKEKINAVLPGTFNNTPKGLEYVEDGIPLKATNLATGSKMFAIIKMILDKYGLDDSTMLILDEPEAHLHPKWQNAFAEVIAILVKDLGVNVLLTSHSPTFVLAIEAFMRKYELIEKTNFYQTEIQDDGFVKYKLVNDDLSVIYEDFEAYYGVVEYIREKYYGEYKVEEREDV